MIVHKKVEFKGQIYWLHTSSVAGYNLSPLEHYSEDGRMIAPDEDAYAVVVNDIIMRFGNVIGLMSDLKDVDNG